MDITIKLSAVLRRYTSSKNGKLNMTLENGATVLDILNGMKVIQGEAGLIILNSKIASERMQP
ncbi:MAG: hypothetical protein IMZ53_15760 [Thermoplasmata archaeon]|nr:hypothetical protein [Thermoplasmata archaeon]